MITIEDIKNILSESTYNLGQLCKSILINKWSFYKPINSDKVQRLTETDIAEVNDGFNLYTFNTPQEMMTDLQNTSTLWDYVDREAPYRLSDFIEYNHDGNLLTTSWIGSSTAEVGNILRFTVDDGNVQNIVNTWKYYSDNLSDYDFVLLIYPYGTIYQSLQPIYIYKIVNKLNYDGSGQFSITIPSALTTGNYTASLCVTDATLSLSEGTCVYDREGDYHGTWCAFPPHTKLDFTVASSSGGGGGGGTTPENYFGYIGYDYSNVDYNYNPDVYILEDLTITMDFELHGQHNGTYDIYATAYFDDASTPIYLGQYSTQLDETNPSGQITWNYKDTIYPLIPNQLADGQISIRFEVIIEKNSNSQTATWTANLQKLK